MKSSGDRESSTTNVITGSEDCVTAMVFARLRLLSCETLQRLLRGWGWKDPFPADADFEYWPRHEVSEAARYVEPDVLIIDRDGSRAWVIEVKWGNAAHTQVQIDQQRAAFEEREELEAMQVHHLAIGNVQPAGSELAVEFHSWSRLSAAVDHAKEGAALTPQDLRILEDLDAVVVEIGMKNIEFESLAKIPHGPMNETQEGLGQALQAVRAALPIVAGYQQRQLEMLRQTAQLLSDRYEFVEWYRAPELCAPSRARKHPWSRSFWDLLHLVGLGIWLRSRGLNGQREHVCCEVLLDASLADNSELWRLDAAKVPSHGGADGPLFRIWRLESQRDSPSDEEWKDQDRSSVQPKPLSELPTHAALRQWLTAQGLIDAADGPLKP